MPCRCPVLTSRNSAMPEVAGNAALYVDPDDIEDMAQGLCRIANDTSLREQLMLQGRTQAQAFSWTRCAQATADVYRRVVECDSS